MSDTLHHLNVVAAALGYTCIASTIGILVAAYISSVREKWWRRRHGAPEMVSLEWHKFDAYDAGARYQSWN